MNPIAFLVLFSLLIVVFRFRQPWKARPVPHAGRTYLIPIRARLKLQRANFYSFAALVLLGAVGGLVPTGVVLIVILIACASVLLPISYTLSSSGIAIGRSAGRAWDDFDHIEIHAAYARLTGHDGARMDVWYPESPSSKQALESELQSFIPGIAADLVVPQRTGSDRSAGVNVRRRGKRVWKGQEA